MNDPQIVSRDEWLAARKRLLAQEKELTRARDEVNAERRRLPMVEIDKEYIFEGVNGKASLLDLTSRGRQEDWEQPPGRGDAPMMSWLRHHDRYE
jgi:predicted dithiol-disulfide oxidoreductase (DUF899 family)